MRKTPKKAIHPLVYEHDPVLQAIGGVFFAKPTFCSGDERQTCHWRWRFVDIQEKAKPEAQLRERQSSEPRRGGGCGKPHQIPHPSYRIYSIFWVYSIYPPQTKQHSLFGHAPRHTIFAKAVFSSLNERSVVHFVQFVAKKICQISFYY